MASDSIDVRIQYLQEGASAVSSTLNNLTKQFNNLTRVNASMALSTGKLAPGFASQALAINQLGGAAQAAGRDLVALKQQGSIFSQIFTGRSSQNVQGLINQFGGASSAMKLMGGQASWLSNRMGEELGQVKVVSDETTGSLRNLTAPERFRIMGHVIGQEMTNASQQLLNMGKNMQWVGRQMTVGLTLPILLGAKSVVMSFLTINKAQTEFQKYMVQNGATTQQALDAFDTTKLGNLSTIFEDISKKTGLYTDEVTNLGAAWVAAGYDVQTAVPQFTMLTAQLDLLAQGEIDQTQAIELVRSVQKAWNLNTAQTVDQVKRLNLIAGTTSLTLGEIAASLPLASSAASLLGLTASQLGALFAGMREKGVTASQAANTLKFAVNRIVNPTKTANDTFQQFFKTQKNITDLFFGRNGQPNGLKGFRELASLFEKLSPEQQGQLAGQLFGGYRADRMLKLIQAINQEGSQFAVGAKEAAPGPESAKAAEDAWQKQIDIIQSSAAQAFKVMKAEFIAIAQKIGALIWPYVNKLGNAILKVLDAFTKAPDFVKGFIVAMGAVLASIGPVIFISGQLIEAFASVKKVLIDMPWNTFFKMSASADPYGLTRLAKETGNPLLKIMSGIPVEQEKIASAYGGLIGLSEKQNLSLGEQLAIWESIGGAIDSNVASASAYTAALSGESLAPLEQRMAMFGPGSEGLLTGQNGLQITKFENLAKNMQEQMPGLTQTGDRFYGMIPSMPPTQGRIAEEMVAESMGISLDDFKAVKSGEKSLLSVVGGKFAIANAEDLSRLSKMAPEVQGAVATAFAEGGGLSLGDSIEQVLTKNVKSGVAGAEVAAKTESISFFQKLKGLFTSGSPLKVLSGSQTGTETAGLFEIVFGSPASIIGIGAAIAVLIKNWQALWRGLKPAIDALGRSWGAFFKKVVSGFQAFANGESATKETANAFQRLGEIIGVLLINFSKLIQGLIGALVFLAGNVIKAVEVAMTLLINLFSALSFKAGAFSDVMSSLGALFNPFNHNLSILQKALAIVVTGFIAWKAAAIGLFIFEKVNALIGFLMEGILRLVLSGIPNAIRGLAALKVSMVELDAGLGVTEIALGDIIQGILTLATVGAGMFLMFHKTSDAADQLASSSGDIADSVAAIINSIKEGTGVLNAFQTALNSVQSAGQTIQSSLPNFDYYHFGQGDQQANVAELQKQLDAAKAAQQAALLAENQSTNPDQARQNYKAASDQVAYLEGQLQDVQKYQGAINQDVSVFVGGLEKAGLNLKYYNQLIKEMKQRIAAIDLEKSFLPVTDPKYGQLTGEEEALKLTMDQLNASGIQQKNMLDSAATGWDNLASKTTSANNAMQKSKEYMDALATEFQQLAGSVQNAFMSQFDAQAQAQTDALAQRQQDASDALQAAQDKQMASFDKTSEHRMNAFQKDADAQVAAIDKKIAAIQKEQDKQDWAQQQEQYRQEKERLIQQQEQSEAMAFAERMKAIHEGRYDDARIIQLQQLADNQDFNNQLNDLDKQHADDVKKHRQDKRTAQLEKEKEQLQKQLDKQKEMLQKQIDAQRAALQKQFDLEKAALQKRQDLQNKMLQQQQDNERQFLENMFTELNEQMPKNKKEWNKYWDDVKQLAKDQGVSLNGIMKQYGLQWHQTLAQGLKDTVGDAGRISGDIGATTASSMVNRYNEVKQLVNTPEDRALVQRVANFVKDMSSKASQLTPDQLKKWLNDLNSSLLASLKSGNPLNINMHQFDSLQHHTGGVIDGKTKADVPAVLQQGEFVIRRDSVAKYGTDFMHKVNAQKYHEGGYVVDAANMAMFDAESKTIADSSTLTAYQQIVGTLYKSAIVGAAEVTKGMIRGLIAIMEARSAGAANAPGQAQNLLDTPTGWGGYHNGFVPLSAMTQIQPGKYLAPFAADWFKKMEGAYGAILPIGSAYRTYAEQLALWNSGGGTGFTSQGWPVARPGTSNHGLGLAVDMDNGSAAWAWMLRNGTKFYWANDVPGDDPHFDYRGPVTLPKPTHKKKDNNQNNQNNGGHGHGTGHHPVGHQGGIFMGDKFKKLEGLKFEGPALLQAGEAVLSRNVVNALNTIGAKQPSAGMEKTVFNINVEIKGDLYGDDQSYEKLYSTLERAGSKIARNRGMGNNSVVRVGVRNAYS